MPRRRRWEDARPALLRGESTHVPRCDVRGFKILYYHLVVFRHETASDMGIRLPFPLSFPTPQPYKILHCRSGGAACVGSSQRCQVYVYTVFGVWSGRRTGGMVTQRL